MLYVHGLCYYFPSKFYFSRICKTWQIYLCFQWKPMYTRVYRGNDKFDSDYWKKTVFVKRLEDLGKKGFFHQALIISAAARAFIRLQTKLTKERSLRDQSFFRIFFVLIAQNISLRLVQIFFKLVGACLNGKMLTYVSKKRLSVLMSITLAVWNTLTHL